MFVLGLLQQQNSGITTNGDILSPVVTSTLTTTAPVLFEVSSGGLQSFASLAKSTEFQFGLEMDKKGFATGKPLFSIPTSSENES